MSGHVGPWPAFVDLFAASTLILLVFFLVMSFVFLKSRGNGVQIQQLKKELEALAQRDHQSFQVLQEGTDVLIVMEEKVTFPQNQSSLDSLRIDAREALRNIGCLIFDKEAAITQTCPRVASPTIAGRFESLIREVEVVGHADRWKFRAGAGQTNWGLSAARAVTVAQFLVDSVGLNPCIIVPSGRGEFFPRDPRHQATSSRDTLNALDRRIELLLHPKVVGHADAGRPGCRAR
ncbi:MAG: flagellar motor protein MotB [Gemmatimonadetes bacterium]|nr:flagellar motor protein MotB [Gemmatimonadota bacterium]